MGELGIDIKDHRPQSLDDLDDRSFDLVVTLSPEAHHQALELTRDQAIAVEYWPIQDPTVADGPREARLDAYPRGPRRLAEAHPRAVSRAPRAQVLTCRKCLTWTVRGFT